MKIRWIKSENGALKCFIENYNENIPILEAIADKDDSSQYIYISYFLEVEYDIIKNLESEEDAKYEFEELIRDYILDKIQFYEGLLCD